MQKEELENIKDRKVSFSSFNTLKRFKKDEPTIYIGNKANNTRIMNYIIFGLNITLLIGFFLLFYFLDMISNV
jgi:hypothetical protein